MIQTTSDDSGNSTDDCDDTSSSASLDSISSRSYSSSSCDGKKTTTATQHQAAVTTPRLTLRLSPEKKAALMRQRWEERTIYQKQQKNMITETERLLGDLKRRKESVPSPITSPSLQTQVQCDSCGSWHTLPLSVNPESLPDIWTCSMITWNTKKNICNDKNRCASNTKTNTCPSITDRQTALDGSTTILPSSTEEREKQGAQRKQDSGASLVLPDVLHRPWTPPFDHLDERVHNFAHDFPLVSANISSPEIQPRQQSCDFNALNSDIQYLEDSCSYSNDETSHWVRRSVRLPNRSVLTSSGMISLIEKLKCNDVTIEVLKMKEYLPHMNTPCVALDSVLDALETSNTNVQAIYIQNYNEGMRDAQVLHLLRILQQGRIWCFNLGETYRVKMKTWKIFATGLKQTNVTHCYLSEHTITPRIKEDIRSIIRENRRKHNRHIDPNNIDVIERCTHCWWNPINAKALQPFLKDAGKEHLLSPEVQNTPLVGSRVDGCPPMITAKGREKKRKITSV